MSETTTPSPEPTESTATPTPEPSSSPSSTTTPEPESTPSGPSPEPETSPAPMLSETGSCGTQEVPCVVAPSSEFHDPILLALALALFLLAGIFTAQLRRP